MTGRKAVGHAVAAGRKPGARQAAARVPTTLAAAAGRRAASTWRPNHPPYAPRQGFKATAPQGFEPRPVGAETVSIEAAPSGRSTDASITLALSHFSGGLSMARIARNLLYPSPKSFPVNHLRMQSAKNMGDARKYMILRSYTLCEVSDGGRCGLPQSTEGPDQGLGIVVGLQSFGTSLCCDRGMSRVVHRHPQAANQGCERDRARNLCCKSTRNTQAETSSHG